LYPPERSQQRPEHGDPDRETIELPGACQQVPHRAAERLARGGEPQDVPGDDDETLRRREEEPSRPGRRREPRIAPQPGDDHRDHAETPQQIEARIAHATLHVGERPTPRTAGGA